MLLRPFKIREMFVLKSQPSLHPESTSDDNEQNKEYQNGFYASVTTISPVIAITAITTIPAITAVLAITAILATSWFFNCFHDPFPFRFAVR
ncbi:hypothetical protein XI25_28375 [Paenibacillus sp. DMB20]|nr:hypothetical protein XI25_28375 [Paenibacillus sp. DMB20]